MAGIPAGGELCMVGHCRHSTALTAGGDPVAAEGTGQAALAAAVHFPQL